MRFRLLIICVVVLLCFSFPAFAQVSLWKALMLEASESAAEKQFADAISVAQEALKVAEKTFGERHSNTLETMNLLAEYYRFNGDEKKAGELESKVKKIVFEDAKKNTVKAEAQYGSLHPKTANALTGLAMSYHQSSRSTTAEKLLLEALDITEKTSGKNSRETAQVLDELTVVYLDTEQKDKAESSMIRALSIRETVLGPNDPATIQTAMDLGDFYARDGKLDTAKPFFLQAYAARKDSLGEADPKLIPMMLNLGEIFLYQGKLTESEKMYSDALAAQKKLKGKDHPDVAHTMIDIATVYLEQKEYDIAEGYLIDGISILEKEFGKESRSLISPLDKLGEAQGSQKKYDEAVETLTRSLALKEKHLGEGHPEVLGTLINLADAAGQAGDKEKASELFARALAMQTKLLSEQDPAIAESYQAMGNIAQESGDMTSAIMLKQKSLEIIEQAYGENHATTADYCLRLADAYVADKMYEQAIPLLVRAETIWAKEPEKNAKNRASAFINLGDLNYYLEKFDASEGYYLQGLKILEKEDGPASGDVGLLLLSMGEMYHSKGDKIKGIAAYNRAIKIFIEAYGPNHAKTHSAEEKLKNLKEDPDLQG